MSKQFAAILAVIILAFGGIILISSHKSSSSSNSKTSTTTATNHVMGSTSTGVRLVEYGDFECPYCEQYYPTVKAVTTEFKDQIEFQFRNFPLVNVHQNAFAGARAAEAAALQGKYWEMHDALYEPSNWQVWSTSNNPTVQFKQYAAMLGLNAAKFASDFASTKVNDTVRADMDEGNRLNIQGTPTFFLDGKQVTVANDQAAFEKVIKAEIAKKAPTATSSATTPASTGPDSSTSSAATDTATPTTTQ